MDLLPALMSKVVQLRENPALRRTMTTVEVSWPVPMRAIGAQNLLTMPGGVSTSGYLHKKGARHFSLRGWPLRYIILHKGCLYYFRSSTSPAPQGAFSLSGYNRVMRAAEETTSSNVFPFKIVHFSKKHRTWFFSAASEDERRKWMGSLRREIDYYNDRRDSLSPSDPDSDADSFYDSIEQPLDINHDSQNHEDDDMIGDDEDDDEDDDNYVEPDDSPTFIDKPTTPPPSYPPPPVPCPNRQDPAPNVFKYTPPPVPLPNRTSTSSIPKKLPPPLPAPKHPEAPPSKAPPPALPYAPHLLRPGTARSPPTHRPGPSPPPPPLPNVKRPILGRVVTTYPRAMDLREAEAPCASLPAASTLPICNDLRSRMVLDRGLPRPPPPFGMPGTHNHGLLPPSPRLGHPGHPPPAPPANPVPHPRPDPPQSAPRFPPPKPKSKGAAIQRTSPEGQSFRSSIEEKPPQKKSPGSRVHTCKNGEENSDEDYENIQLPESVFVETTETCTVERMFKDNYRSPQDGLYCIRNSGTKTSQVLVVWDVSLNKARNYRLFHETSRVFLESDVSFPSLAALVEHYYSHPLPNHGSLCLQQPYGYTVLR